MKIIYAVVELNESINGYMQPVKRTNFENLNDAFNCDLKSIVNKLNS